MGQNLQIFSEETSTQITLPNNRVKISSQTPQKLYPLNNLNLSIVSESKELHLSNQGTLEDPNFSSNLISGCEIIIEDQAHPTQIYQANVPELKLSLKNEKKQIEMEVEQKQKMEEKIKESIGEEENSHEEVRSKGK
jgi:hypothetical protein